MRENSDDEAPEPNPVFPIIATRGLQTLAVSLPLLTGARLLLPPERYRTLESCTRWIVTVGLSAYFVATFHARTPIIGGDPLVVRLPRSDPQAVALTFDDGPHPETTPRILEALAEAGAKATFFLVGERVARYPHLARRIVTEGHVVGVHAMHHRPMVLLSAGQIAEELRKAVSVIEEAIGEPLRKPRLLRPPYGFKTATLGRVATEAGFRIVAWSVDPRDYDDISPEMLESRVINRITPGDIVLLHEHPGVNATLIALPRLLRRLRERGFVFPGIQIPS